MTMRTQEEIVARIKETRESDLLGWRIEVLIEGLDFEHAEPWRNPDLTAAEWPEPSPEDLLAKARGYFDFARDKIADHRGISAERSTVKLGEYAWMLGREDVVEAMGKADYPQYGAPKVKAFGHGFGWWPEFADAELARMADGLPCRDGCENGCGT